jgi:hypothetical protein
LADALLVTQPDIVSGRVGSGFVGRGCGQLAPYGGRAWHLPKLERATYRPRSRFGAGALISSVSFELVQEGMRVAGALPVALGLAAGALVFFVSDRYVERIGGRSRGGAAGLPLLLGALLDGIPAPWSLKRRRRQPLELA